MEKRTGLLCVIIFVVVMLVGSFLLASRQRSGAVEKHMDTPTIYTALPRQTNQYYRPFTAALKHFSTQLNTSAPVVTITKQHLTHPTSRFTYDDIWLRDVAPVITTRMVKFRYAPSYLAKADRDYLDSRFRVWLKQMHFTYRTSDLVLDGGNLVWNQDDTVILTTHVFKDNPEWSRQEIISELKYQLNVSHVIIIPTEPGDVLGHADGMVKFINTRTLYVSDFSGDDDLVHTVERRVKAVLPDAKFVILPSAYTDKDQYDRKIASAKGLYINMLETPDTIYVPRYDLPADQRALKIVRQHTTKRVVPIDVAKISTTGGSIHCLTWDVPARFMPGR
ncbi:agmatine deiminase family protein [Schleiferilactobacillus perolens]|uniref:Peptidyl-arginine deiminase n=1 Tax=Schleiferilactobacillus perolens DSM 12744 TaxID=1423792 RepID=A0A0R1MVW1_9LACO|nr:agmatine deiminase family protein [Schleiferilactobacillus perolens]KRL12413.1 peptidyl-arginine deiminase [Schleiferilactobacillus perolens DSM 12744]